MSQFRLGVPTKNEGLGELAGNFHWKTSMTGWKDNHK